ncbi:polymorphic toxin type 33 domain-containing protein [Holdemania massiliensis]|uniref:polymorphic toxin type 33 domain-containing protein n=1 Tax=Holdemania massiliensis TaxID=1468449 RepID=UPI001F056F5E|nr:polymorphic toxin type 33 domain-containing protein [Holdemania massiliensis]MCH1939865.1 polymorphic toxin type 33 domain-containing protein [Holdemania massiliensis]
MVDNKVKCYQYLKSYETLPVLAGILGHAAVAGYAGATVYSIYEYKYVDKEKGTQDLTKVALSTVGSLEVLGSTGSINAGGTPSIGIQGDGSAALSGEKLIGYTLSLDAAVASDPAVSAALGITQAAIANGGGSFGEQSGVKSDDKGDSDFEKGNYNKVKDNYLKKNGIDAHELKKDFLGRKAPIAEYDIYVDKDTGELFIFKKGGKGVGIPIGEFIK